MDASRPAVLDRMNSYVDILCSEIEHTHSVSSAKLETVFFGGGTPSLISPELLERILQALDSKFG